MADEEAGRTADLVDEIEQPESIATRLWIFLKSMAPKDPWQLVFLVGTILLFVSPRLSWMRMQSGEELVKPPISGRLRGRLSVFG